MFVKEKVDGLDEYLIEMYKNNNPLKTVKVSTEQMALTLGIAEIEIRARLEFYTKEYRRFLQGIKGSN